MFIIICAFDFFCNASFFCNACHVYQEYFGVHPVVSVGTYPGCDSRSDHICSAPVPHATARVIMSLTTRSGCISIFVYWFKLRTSVSVLLLDVTARST